MPAPLIEFSQFAHPQRWWLRRGPPPWLDDCRWQARAFRASLVLGVMGTVSAGLTTILVFLTTLLRSFDLEISSVILVPGASFGILTLVPLSRWMGRGWILTLLAVPVSMAASSFSFMTVLMTRSWFGRSDAMNGALAGLVGGLILCFWMGVPNRERRSHTSWFGVILAAFSCGLVMQVRPDKLLPMLPPEVSAFFSYSMLYGVFQSLIAISVGVRLWPIPPQQPPQTN